MESLYTNRLQPLRYCFRTTNGRKKYCIVNNAKPDNFSTSHTVVSITNLSVSVLVTSCAFKNNRLRVNSNSENRLLNTVETEHHYKQRNTDFSRKIC